MMNDHTLPVPIEMRRIQSLEGLTSANGTNSIPMFRATHIILAACLAIPCAISCTARNTPESTLRLYAEALRDGDRKKLGSLLYTRNESDRRVTESFVRLAVASAELRRSATAAFGPAKAEEILEQHGSLSPTLIGERLLGEMDEAGDDLNLEVSGHQATLRASSSVLLLIRRGAEWKVDVTEDDEEGATDTVRLLDLLSHLVESAARGVASGEIKTPEQASDALIFLARHREVGCTGVPDGA
jgi:hypothetical protein